MRQVRNNLEQNLVGWIRNMMPQMNANERNNEDGGTARPTEAANDEAEENEANDADNNDERQQQQRQQGFKQRLSNGLGAFCSRCIFLIKFKLLKNN